MCHLCRLLIARVVEPSAVKSLRNRGPQLFFLTVKIPFPPRGLDFLTENTDYLTKVKHHSFIFFFHCFLVKSLLVSWPFWGDAGRRRTPLLSGVEKCPFGLKHFTR